MLSTISFDYKVIADYVVTITIKGEYGSNECTDIDKESHPDVYEDSCKVEELIKISKTDPLVNLIKNYLEIILTSRNPVKKFADLVMDTSIIETTLDGRYNKIYLVVKLFGNDFIREEIAVKDPKHFIYNDDKDELERILLLIKDKFYSYLNNNEASDQESL